MATSNDTTSVKCCTKCKEVKPISEFRFRRERPEPSCKKCETKAGQENYWKNPERHRQRRIERYWEERDPEGLMPISTHRVWSRAHPDQAAALRKEQKRVQTHRRLARKRELPDTLTAIEWQYALDYFVGMCAYCGCPQGLWNSITADHFIPLSSPDCVGTVASNMLPACAYCNTSKCDNDPYEWVVRKFGKRKAKTIFTRIDAYFQAIV